jgi:hypothetical protein
MCIVYCVMSSIVYCALCNVILCALCIVYFVMPSIVYLYFDIIYHFLFEFCICNLQSAAVISPLQPSSRESDVSTVVSSQSGQAPSGDIR